MWKQDHSFHLPYNFQKGRCLLDSEATKPQSHITPLITQDFYIFRHLIMSYDWGLDFSKPVKVPLLTCSPNLKRHPFQVPINPYQQNAPNLPIYYYFATPCSHSQPLLSSPSAHHLPFKFGSGPAPDPCYFSFSYQI